MVKLMEKDEMILLGVFGDPAEHHAEEILATTFTKDEVVEVLMKSVFKGLAMTDKQEDIVEMITKRFSSQEKLSGKDVLGLTRSLMI